MARIPEFLGGLNASGHTNTRMEIFRAQDTYPPDVHVAKQLEAMGYSSQSKAQASLRTPRVLSIPTSKNFGLIFIDLRYLQRIN